MLRVIAVSAVLLVASLLSGPGALARPLHPPPVGTAADLAPRGCVDDNDTGPEDCAVSTDGLNGAVGVVVSPDGNSLYAISGIQGTDAAVVEFARNTATGGLTPLGCIDDTTGPDTCAQSEAGFGRLTGIAVSPDGTSVYATSESSNTVFIFNRDPATGLLTPAGCVNDNNGPFICSQSTAGLGIAEGVAVSSDGLSVFVSSAGDSAVVRFDRNPATGALLPADCIDDTETGPDACAQSTIGLTGAVGGSSIALDARGESLYVASYIDNAVVELARDPASKVITPLGCIDDNDTGPDPCSVSTDGLDHAGAVAISPDSTSVYATSQVDGAIVIFGRDPATGLLTPQGCIDGPDGPDTCAQTAEGVSNAYAVAVSPDSRSVFTVARTGIVVGFDRDPATGALHPASCISDAGEGGRGFCSAEAPALNNAFDIAISPDGNFAYAVSQIDGIQIFGLNPPDTSLVAGPKAKTDDRLATFKFGSEEAGVTFACALDKLSFKQCTSPKTVRVKPGKHTFSVAATDQAGNADASPDEYQWRVKKRN